MHPIPHDNLSNFCASALHYQRTLLKPFQVFCLAEQCSLFVRKKKKKKNSFILACKKLQNWDLRKAATTETVQTERSKTNKQNKTKGILHFCHIPSPNQLVKD